MTKTKCIEYHQLNALKKAAMNKIKIVVITHGGQTFMGQAYWASEHLVGIIEEYSGEEMAWKHSDVYATAIVGRFSTTF